MKAIGIKMVELQPMRAALLAKFIAESPIYQSLVEDEKEDMKEQLTAMYKYSNILASRLDRVGVDVTTL